MTSKFPKEKVNFIPFMWLMPYVKYSSNLSHLKINNDDRCKLQEPWNDKNINE